MKLIYCMFFLILCAALIGAQSRRTIRPKPMTHDQIIKELQAEAKRRNVYWRVWCTAYYEGDEEKYQGVATAGSDLNIYAEDGATPYWQAYGDFKTADAAAFALLQTLRKPPNVQPQHRDKKRAEQCPVPLTGGPKE